MKKILFTFCLVLLLTSCYKYREKNSLAVPPDFNVMPTENLNNPIKK